MIGWIQKQAQRQDDVKTQGEDAHLPVRERSLEQNLPSQPSEGTGCPHILTSDFKPPEL